MKYVLHGDPIPLARPRHTQHHVYNPQHHDQRRTKVELIALHDKKPFLQGPLGLEVNFYMPMPASWSAKKKEAMAGKLHMSKPDFSNLLKYIEDCGTGVCYKDDALIASVTGKKIYDYLPRTELFLTEIKT